MPKPTVIPLSVPALRGNELKYLKQCVDTNWVSYIGSFVSRLEKIMATTTRTRYAVATNSGTAALHTAFLVAAIRPGDEVLIPDLTFIASANSASYCGAVPVFMDVRLDTGQIDHEKLARFLSEECREKGGLTINAKTGRPVRAVVPVHLLGHPCDMDPILSLAGRFHLLVIEDAAQGMGALYKGKPVGGLGDLGCFSYNGNKIVTAGGGGMITTDNAAWARRAKYLTTQAKDSPDEYIHESIGYNYRLTNIQAAVAVAQMELLKKYIRIKREIARRYQKGLGSIPGLTLPKEQPWAFSNHWLTTIRVDERLGGRTRQGLQKVLERHRIQSRPLWAPCHEQRPYRNCQAYRIEAAPVLYRQALSLPSSIGLSERNQERVISLIRDYFKN